MGLIKVIQDEYDMVRVQKNIDLLILIKEDVIKEKMSTVMRAIN